MKPKKKNAKAQKLAKQKLEEERLRLEEIERERVREEKRKLEEERLRKEEEERIRAEEAVIRKEQHGKLETLFSEMADFYKSKLILEWNDERWTFYLYKTTKVDTLDLKAVNSFLSEWKDERDSDVQAIFKKCHECLQMLEELRSATMRCPGVDDKTLGFWKEAMKNLKAMISKKLDLATFNLLKDGQKYLSEETQNVECGVTDLDCDDSPKEATVRNPVITLCVWANIYTKNRRRGLEILDFSFHLPAELVSEDCAVRVMHTIFDHVTPEILRKVGDIDLDVKEPISSESGVPEVSQKSSLSTVATEEVDRALSMVEMGDLESSVTLNTEVDKLGPSREESDDTTDVDKALDNAIMEAKESNTSHKTLDEDEAVVEPTESASSLPIEEIEDFATKYPLPAEPELEFVNDEEYFPVGGVFDFGLYAVPTLHAESGCWIFNYSSWIQSNFRFGSLFFFTWFWCALKWIIFGINKEEEEGLQKLKFDRFIIPPRDPTENMSDEEAADFANYERQRFHSEMNKNCILLDLKLPGSVLYLEQPVPARYIENKGFSRNEIMEPKFHEDSHRVSFKTSRFGIYQTLQRKYANMPYKAWSITRGKDPNSVRLLINGARVAVTIEITDRGCCIQQIDNEKGIHFSHLYSEWTTPNQLIMKLKLLGINIAVEKNAAEYIGKTRKERKTEDWIYKCISMLCHVCDFSSSNLNSALPSDEFILKYNLIMDDSKSVDYLALITPERATCRQSIENELSLLPEALPGLPFCSNLYHLVFCGMDEALMEKVKHPDYSLAYNAYLLLNSCRLLTCL